MRLKNTIKKSVYLKLFDNEIPLSRVNFASLTDSNCVILSVILENDDLRNPIFFLSTTLPIFIP